MNCENATVERKLVYPGFLTWDGYQKFAMELGGQSPKWLTFGRGMYPLSALQNTLIPYSLLEEVIGTYLFTGRTIGCGGIDLAAEEPATRSSWPGWPVRKRSGVSAVERQTDALGQAQVCGPVRPVLRDAEREDDRVGQLDRDQVESSPATSTPGLDDVRQNGHQLSTPMTHCASNVVRISARRHLGFRRWQPADPGRRP